MKYFVNFPYTAETLKKEYREFCKKLHPDTGGSEAEFKAMAAEYEQTARNLNGTRQNAAQQAEREARRQAAEEAAREAEEARREREEARRRRQEEEAREREEEERRKAAARPAYEKKCKKWAHLMEDLNTYAQAETTARQTYGWSSKEYKAARTAFTAARRRNLVAMAKAAFPGIKFTASINTGWGGGATIAWTEGPTVEEFKAATDYEIFVSGWDTFDGMTDCAGYERAMFTEFANNYGQFSGGITYDRTETKEHRAEVADMICSVKPSAAEQRAKDGRREDCSVFLDDEEIIKICSLLGIDADKFKQEHRIYGSYGESHYFDLWAEWFTKWSHWTAPEKAPEFAPKYGETYRRIKKALGGNVFGIRKTEEIKDIFALCDDLTDLEIGKIFMWEGKAEFSGMYSSNIKNREARKAKMEAVGITLDYSGCRILSVSDEVRAALIREREDIEKQREQWEQAQQDGHKAEKADRPTDSKQDSQKADSGNEKPANVSETADSNEAPADGLTLEEVDGVLCVIGNSHTTFKNRKAIKAHGATWNKAAQRWEATTEEARETLRRWFAMRDTSAQAEQEPTTATESETTGAPTLEDSREISALLEAVADLLQTFADIMQQAKRWEGVTVPAATLERWKQEATDGTKTAAARLCEVCACLGSLTPESRREFDALGVIFWTLSEQLKQGADPATIGTATDFARAQLFDLISRTQNENQARAVREANDPTAAPADPFRKAA